METVVFPEFKRTKKTQVLHELASLLHVANAQDVEIVFRELMQMAADGKLNDDQIYEVQFISDKWEQLEALDNLWIFGHRYMAHYFKSNDPFCPKCRNSVPHRTMLYCPTCHEPGPWLFEERYTPSSYLHYVLTDQIIPLF